MKQVQIIFSECDFHPALVSWLHSSLDKREAKKLSAEGHKMKCTFSVHVERSARASCKSVLCVHALTGQLRRSPMLLALRSSSPNMSGVGFSLHSSILTAWLLQHWTHTHTHKIKSDTRWVNASQSYTKKKENLISLFVSFSAFRYWCW